MPTSNDVAPAGHAAGSGSGHPLGIAPYLLVAARRLGGGYGVLIIGYTWASD